MIEKHPAKNHQIHETVSMVGCQFCSAIFKTEEILKEHVEKTHKYNAPKAVVLLNCKFCGASFKTDGLMKEHIQRIHPEKEKPVYVTSSQNVLMFPCHSCPQLFENEILLKGHIDIIHVKVIY